MMILLIHPIRQIAFRTDYMHNDRSAAVENGTMSVKKIFLSSDYSHLFIF